MSLCISRTERVEDLTAASQRRGFASNRRSVASRRRKITTTTASRRRWLRWLTSERRGNLRQGSVVRTGKVGCVDVFVNEMSLDQI